MDPRARPSAVVGELVMPGPLEGIRVIDLTTVISGPVCTAILADQGADVVKVEPPGGEIGRRTAGDGEFTAMFVSAHRGQRSVALDLKQPAHWTRCGG